MDTKKNERPDIEGHLAERFEAEGLKIPSGIARQIAEVIDASARKHVANSISDAPKARL